jgi:hypothetical protein
MLCGDRSAHAIAQRLLPIIVGLQHGINLRDMEQFPNIGAGVPSNKEAVFRAAVLRDDLPVSDVLQVWLDASVHSARGREQADEIRRRILKPLFGKHS